MTTATVARAAISTGEVRVAVERLLRDQLPVALVARTEKTGVELKEPASWQQVGNPRLLTDLQIPCVEVSSPGWTAPPERRSGRYAAEWSVIVTVYVRGKGRENVVAVVDEYVTAIAAVLVADAHPHLDGLAERVVLNDLDHSAIDVDSRTLGGGAVEVIYTIDHAATSAA